MCKKRKKKKAIYIDDGHTVYDMNGLSPNSGNKKQKEERVHLSFKEKKAVIRAAFERFLPILLLVIVCFSVTMVLVYFWFK